MHDSVVLRKELASSAAILALAVAYFWVGLQYPLDTLDNPGPGVFPRAMGLLLIGLSSTHLVASTRRLRRASRAPAPAAALAGAPQDADLSAAVYTPWFMVAVLAAYVVLLGRIGFMTTSFALGVACSKLMGAEGWLRPLALGAGLVIACHFLFSVWLHVPLPTGLIG